MQATENTRMNVTTEQARRFQDLFRDHRQRLGKTQAEIAADIGVSQSLVSTLERGPHVGMRVFDLFKVLKFYGIEANEIAEILGFQVPPESERDMSDRLRAIMRAIERLPEKQIEQVEDFLDIFLRGLTA